ncbi:unnamed protein product, partial [marine sediment metagenome]
SGLDHSDGCEREHDEALNPDMVIIREALERYCDEVRDPRKGYMITNAKDMMEWLLKYDSSKYTTGAPEIFTGTRDALEDLGV